MEIDFGLRLVNIFKQKNYLIMVHHYFGHNAL